MDYENARANMIEQQIRPWNVLAMQTLNALNTIRREDFVPSDLKHQAFMDIQIPLAHGEAMLEPKLAARMMESLDLKAQDRVLEIGTGSGFLTAMMASICASVDSIEIHPELSQQAQRNLGMAGITNTNLVVDDGHGGWGDVAAYDAIIITGSLPSIGQGLLSGLAIGGRLVGIEGHEPAMQVVRYNNVTDGISRQALFETVVPRLHNVEEPVEFTF